MGRRERCLLDIYAREPHSGRLVTQPAAPLTLLASMHSPCALPRSPCSPCSPCRRREGRAGPARPARPARCAHPVLALAGAAPAARNSTDARALALARGAFPSGPRTERRVCPRRRAGGRAVDASAHAQVPPRPPARPAPRMQTSERRRWRQSRAPVAGGRQHARSRAAAVAVVRRGRSARAPCSARRPARRTARSPQRRRAAAQRVHQAARCFSEATSARTLQLVAGMFEKATIRTPELPCVPKSYDDASLRPANTRIGERLRARAASVHLRLPGQAALWRRHQVRVRGHRVPAARRARSEPRFWRAADCPSGAKKCRSACDAYYQTYNYLAARTVRDFQVDSRCSCRPFPRGAGVEAPNDADADADAEARRAAQLDLPTHASPVAARDGHLPSAMLFVDEQWMNTRTAREGRMGAHVEAGRQVLLAPLPVPHREDGTPQIVQVGIGADEARVLDETGFGRPAAATAVRRGARRSRCGRAC